MAQGKEKGNRPKYDYSTDLQQWIEEADVVAVDEPLAAQRTQFDCARCRTSWSCPTIAPEKRREVADLVRRAQLLDAVATLRLVGFTFSAAKPTMIHITLVPGTCNKCSRVFSEDTEQVVCRCGSLNLNW